VPFFLPDQVAVRPDETLALVALGLALFARELGWRPALWGAVLPLAIGLRGLLAVFAGKEIGLGGWIEAGPATANSALPLSGMTTSCLVLGGGALFWNAFERASRSRLFTTAFSGSVVASVGCSTLFGYVANLPTV
jgi:hypothetical protein